MKKNIEQWIDIFDVIFVSAFAGFGMFWFVRLFLQSFSVFFAVFYGMLGSSAVGAWLMSTHHLLKNPKR